MLTSTFTQGSKYSGLFYLLITAAFFLLFATDDATLKQLPTGYLPTAAIALFLAFLFNKQPKLTFDLNWIVYSLLVVLVVYGSLINAIRPEHSIFRTLIYRDLGLFGFALYLCCRSDLANFAEFILLGMVSAFLVITPITLWEYLSGVLLLNEPTRHINPDLSYYLNIRHFGYHAFIAAGFATILLFVNSNYRRVYLAITLFCVTALIISGGRGAIAAYFLFLLLLAWNLFRWQQIIKFSLIGVASASIVLFVLWLSPLHQIADSLLDRTNLSAGFDSLLSGRLTVWKDTINGLSDHLLLGMGANSYVLLADRDGVVAIHPHNSLLQFSLEFGVLGTTIILFSVWKLLSPLMRATQAEAQHSNLPWMLSRFVIAYFAFSLIDGLFFHSLPMVHFAVVIAMLAGFQVKQRKE